MNFNELDILGNIDISDANPVLQKLLLALDATTIIAITDQDGTILHVNDRFCEISQYSREELIGENHRVLKSDFHSPEFFEHMWRTISSGKNWHGEIKNRAKDGSYYWVETSIIPFIDASGVPYRYVAIRKDITDKKMLAEEVEFERDKVINAEKMASLGEMAAGIAHEVGNPLSAIRGRIELLMMKAQSNNLSPETVTHTGEMLLKIVDRTSKIIRGLKSYARDASGDPVQQTDVSQMISDILDFSQSRIEKSNVQLETSGLDQKISAECREAEISQVLVNLINNACDVLKDSQVRKMSIRLKCEDEWVSLDVLDSGPGIPEHIKNRIFDPFFTTKDVGSGTGLGLSIAKRIMESHAGSLELVEPGDSEFKTCFRLTWPVGQVSAS